MTRLLAVVLLLVGVLCASPARAAITFFASATAASSGAAALAITPPATMQANDYVILLANLMHNTAATTLSIGETGGQAWTSEVEQDSAEAPAGAWNNTRLFHCRYDGTWTADPSVDRSASSGSSFTLTMLVFRGVDVTTALDVAAASGQFTAPGSPFDVTVTGITTLTNNAMAVFLWTSNDDNTWTLQTGGWAQDFTEVVNTTGTDSSQTHAYKIQATAGGTGNVTNRQATLGGDAGVFWTLALKEQATAARRRLSPMVLQ
jgi:hypothetical protein